MNNNANCQEYLLDDVMAICAIPIANIPLSDPSSVANCLGPTIRKADFVPSYDGAITIGLQPAVSGGKLIPIRRTTGKAKDDTSDSVAGRLHTVTVTCDVDDRDGAVWADLLMLERMPSHLRLTFRNQSLAFVSANRDSYLCTVERDGARTTVTLRIQCLMGVQPII